MGSLAYCAIGFMWNKFAWHRKESYVGVVDIEREIMREEGGEGFEGAPGIIVHEEMVPIDTVDS